MPYLNYTSAANKNRTVMMGAAVAGNVKSVAFLAKEMGCDANVTTPDSSYTALHQAAYIGHAEVVRVLLEAGADHSIRNKYEETALMAARSAKKSAGTAECVEVLDKWEKERRSGGEEKVGEEKVGGSAGGGGGGGGDGDGDGGSGGDGGGGTDSTANKAMKGEDKGKGETDDSERPHKRARLA